MKLVDIEKLEINNILTKAQEMLCMFWNTYEN